MKKQESMINISEVLRKTLDDEIVKKEEEEARKSSRRIAEELNLTVRDVVKLIREDRESEIRFRYVGNYQINPKA
ncbi:VapB-type antitoxin [Sulfurisphaera tokodaii]|nr:VapB-type antitoxin [Sulfurisphaera tokodaii]